MNEDQLETRLRQELRRRHSVPDAPDWLYRHVDGLSDENTVTAPSHFPRIRFGVRAVGGLAGAAVVAALIVAGLVWRPTPVAGPAASGSSTAAPSTAATPTRAPSSPIPAPTSTPVPTWVGAAPNIHWASRLDDRFAFAMAGSPQRLLVTNDGGASWSDRTPPVQASGSSRISDVRFTDALTGWVTFEESIGQTAQGNPRSTHWVYRTTDGGLTWSRPAAIAAPADYQSGQLFALDGDHAWAAFTGLDAKKYPGESGQWTLGQLWSTSDGGATWTLKASGDKRPDWPANFGFTSPTDGWADATQWTTTSQAALVRTTDGGKTWTKSALPMPAGYTQSLDFGLPTQTGGPLLLIREVYNPMATTTTTALAEWESADGAGWKLILTTPLNGKFLYREPRGGTAVLADPGPPWSAQRFDMATQTVTVGIDLPTPCRANTGLILQVMPMSAVDLWILCAVPGTGPGLAPKYMYGTSDGGITWRAMIGAPAAQ